MVGGLFVQHQFIQRHFIHVFWSYFFCPTTFSPISKRSLVTGTLTLNPIGQNSMDEVLLDELLSDKKLKPAVTNIFSSVTGSSEKSTSKKKKPKLEDLIEQRDFTGALALLEFSRNTKTPVENLDLWCAFCHFHLGDYKQAYDVYYTLMKEPKHNPILYVYIACCCFYLGLFKEAKEYGEKGPDSPLKNRLLMHVMLKLKNEEEMSKYHKKLNKKDMEDQLCLAGLFCNLGNYTDALTIYKGVLSADKTYLAMHVYMALCYYKMDVFDLCQETLSKYLDVHPVTAIGINLKACNHFRLYDGKSAEVEMKHFLQVVSSNYYFGEELIRHNRVVFRNGEDALHVLSPLVDVIQEARLNLAIFYLKEDQYSLAHTMVKNFEPSNSWEYVLKAVVFAYIGQEENNKKYLKLAQQYFQHVGKAPGECDTVLGRQCMASCLFLLRHFTDVIVYLDSIKGYMYSDDHYNFNYGQAKAAVGHYKEAEEAFLLIKSEKLKKEYVYVSWLAKCLIKNKKPDQAWILYRKMETSGEAYSLLHLIANECYKMGQFYISAKAFDALEQLDHIPEYWEGKRGACMGVFYAIVTNQTHPEKISELLNLLRNGVDHPQLQYIVQALEMWAAQHRVRIN